MRPPKTRCKTKDALEKIVKYKKDNDLTYDSLAHSIGVSGGTLRTWISKSKNPTIEAWLEFQILLLNSGKSKHLDILIPTEPCDCCGIVHKENELLCPVKNPGFKITRPKKKSSKRPRPKLTPPPCPDCGKVDGYFKYINNQSACNHCGGINVNIEIDNRIRYKY